MSSLLLRREGDLAWVTLSNPGKLNALDLNLWRQLATCFTQLNADDSVRCVLIEGADGNFAAGADIAEFSTVRSTLEQGILYHAGAIGTALAAIEGCIHPVVAAIEGACVGGGLEIACVCDLRIAAPSARFGIPINRLGFALAPGEMPALLRLVGPAVALEMLLEGQVFGAAEALEKGLLTRLADDVPAAAREAAQRIAAGAPLAARMNKHLVRRLGTAGTALNEAETAAAFALLSSADYREGVAAFLEKRLPVFTGK